MLDAITPVILTYNEAANIGRTLDALSWARDIVVVDSGSDDATVDILRTHRNVRVFQRAFDTHANQWNFAIGKTGVRSDWILSLDADYVLSASLVDELRKLEPPVEIAAYSVEFEYCIFGKPLRGSVYPPVTALFRASLGEYRQDGHTQRLNVLGPTGKLANRIRHDDRKPLSRWLAAQSGYMELEASKLASTPSRDLTIPDRIRKAIVFAPPLVFFYTLFVRATILDGEVGLYYALQRATAEMILSLHLLHRYLGADKP